MNKDIARYVRMIRLSTDSEATIKLPQPMPPLVAELWIETEYPGWTWEFMDSENPDGAYAGYGYEHFYSIFG